MASDSIFESFPSYPQCFMRGGGPRGCSRWHSGHCDGWQ
uniref:RUNX family transcription factor 1 n=1 Tax=Homo sapiens TaxID=9606 RepID=V9GYT3_HUMAN